ncbi:hypothetical protein QFC24_004076 [Naganishia onofrii]|uniref:Uncharacterized protein n=1 Tax=Naganishia onofrii TaxID=1851511 RepID=A0ACC2XF33_9TREE|nr:hypothetical protein QFC24_004076 [Naganishia onofrii]
MIDILDRVSGLLIVLSVCWKCREELRGLLEAARSLDEFPGDCQEELHEGNGSQNEQFGKNTTNDASTPLPAATEAASNNTISLPTEEDDFTSTTYRPSTLTTPSPPVSEIAPIRKGKDKEPIRYASPSFRSSATTVRVPASSPASPTVTPSPIECTTSKVVPKSTAISPSWAFPPYQNAAFNPAHQLKRATFSFGAAGFVGPRPSAAATPETCTRAVDSAEPVKSPWLKRSKKEKVVKETLVLEVVRSQEAASAFGSSSAFGEL